MWTVEQCVVKFYNRKSKNSWWSCRHVAWQHPSSVYERACGWVCMAFAVKTGQYTRDMPSKCSQFTFFFTDPEEPKVTVFIIPTVFILIILYISTVFTSSTIRLLTTQVAEKKFNIGELYPRFISQWFDKLIIKTKLTYTVYGYCSPSHPFLFHCLWISQANPHVLLELVWEILIQKSDRNSKQQKNNWFQGLSSFLQFLFYRHHAYRNWWTTNCCW